MDHIANPLGIKRISLPRGTSPGALIKRADASLLNQAQTLMEAAHQEAAQIVLEAEGQADAIRAATRRETEQKAWQEIDAVLSDLRALREQVAEQNIEAARAIVHKAWEILTGNLSDTEKLACALAQASRYFVSTSSMRLRVNPGEAEQAQNWLAHQRTLTPGLELLTIEGDTAIRAGEVRLYLDRGGVIKADFAGMLETFKAQLT